ncbi:hypothetical protein WOLCODRAFT_162171 [Wolfiporia cocos MD-104 SS10]|uniref:Uncharacterized protein n=1 Tax=Wolfiporia cocos (strain MD-104) TaxID=742152 RepID=A0A2H3JDB5_WOLCO|nr:hypothetical protein WOLCODRAFT_162171 [Wolfiporia cocos MD-104 SS10]
MPATQRTRRQRDPAPSVAPHAPQWPRGDRTTAGAGACCGAGAEHIPCKRLVRVAAVHKHDKCAHQPTDGTNVGRASTAHHPSVCRSPLSPLRRISRQQGSNSQANFLHKRARHAMDVPSANISLLTAVRDALHARGAPPEIATEGVCVCDESKDEDGRASS